MATNDTTLRARVAALERQVAELQAGYTSGAPIKDWRSTVGMFTGDEVMRQIDQAARAIREADRRRARRRKTPKARVQK